ncbi:hypothetical protein R1sor_011198 [Riccia sorocarpa]|uniref:phenylalanine--tRNA ligase n=1 Tax=Riccia sorocarpa TaxID=122646 RepID=A0ABD3I3Y2_9MARC
MAAALRSSFLAQTISFSLCSRAAPLICHGLPTLTFPRGIRRLNSAALPGLQNAATRNDRATAVGAHCHVRFFSQAAMPQAPPPSCEKKKIRATSCSAAASVDVGGVTINRDDIVREDDPANNVPDSVFTKIGLQLHNRENHPLGILKNEIHSYFDERFGGEFKKFDDLSPIVSVKANFDDVLVPADHVSRRMNDTYYVNSETVLRCHTSAHQAEKLREGHTHFLVTGDVYRRDAIDATHYPVFHQMEGFRVFTKEDWEAAGVDGTTHASNDLKATLEGLAERLFGKVEMRWVDTYFPFTDPSYELEIFYQDKWLEVLGCGVVEQEILNKNGRAGTVGWAFGLGLERLAMVLFSIPDIRLFWSSDQRFTGQFKAGQRTKFKSFSKFPPCYKDISFWISDKFSENNLCEVVRGIAGDLVEEVVLIDEFENKKKGLTSHCYRIAYRSMERSLTDEEINDLQVGVWIAVEYTFSRGNRSICLTLIILGCRQSTIWKQMEDESWLEDAEVMSEVHIGSDPSSSSGVSVFAILPFSAHSGTERNLFQKGEGRSVETEEVRKTDDHVCSDEHGDLILPRRRRSKRRPELDEGTEDCVRVHYHLATRLPDVGLQVWKGALLLSDFILHEMSSTERFKDVIAIELGAGTGLVGLIMARFARLVFITDRGTEILDNCTRNVITNCSSLKHGEDSVRVRELDWHKSWPPEIRESEESHSGYNWTPQDIEICEEASVMLAADVVYSPELTDAFFQLLKKLMPLGSKRVLYLAMEKRYNFSFRDQDVVAHGYKHFRTFFWNDTRDSSEGRDADIDSYGEMKHFSGRRIDISGVRQYVKNYDRGEDLELWELRSKNS